MQDRLDCPDSAAQTARYLPLGFVFVEPQDESRPLPIRKRTHRRPQLFAQLDVWLRRYLEAHSGRGGTFPFVSRPSKLLASEVHDRPLQIAPDRLRLTKMDEAG